MNGKQRQAQYYTHLSGYQDWTQLDHSEKWLLFPENIGSHLSMDETSLSRGEIYTIVTNKGAKGRKGVILAMVKGTVSKNVISVLHKLPESVRDKVEEITIDFAQQ